MLLFGSLRKPMPQYLSSSLNMLCSCFYSLLVWVFVFPLLFDGLLQNLAVVLTRPSWGRLERRSAVAEAVMTLHPLAYTLFCSANRDASSPAKKSASSRAECHIPGSIKGVDRLIYTAFIRAISWSGTQEVWNVLQLAFCACLQGCTFPVAMRTATTGRCSAMKAGGSAGVSTSMAGNWWAPGSMATLTAVRFGEV